MLNRALDLVVHCKAVRRVGGYLDLDIGESEIIALSMVKIWCTQFKKEGGPVSKIVGWSGYSRNWKKKIHAAIEDCLHLGLLEPKSMNGGIRLMITAKGESVFRALDVMSERVIEEMEGKREKPKRQKI